MLTLQRASAGSGKTYTLARTYIRHLLSIKEENGDIRLREDGEIPDAVSHILAVTFTNKATNEMKQRIVEKLHALTDTVTPVSKIDYLSDFMSEFGTDRATIARKSGLALKHLLLDFSNFNVSTIDSFFQTVLRTFAYEADVPDSYRLEIDSDYIAGVGVDAVIDRLMNADLDRESLYWINLLTKDTRAKNEDWNIQNRRISTSKSGHVTLYQRLINTAKKLDSESFKEATRYLEDFFNAGKSLVETYNYFEERFLPAFRSTFGDLYRAAKELMRYYRSIDYRNPATIARKDAVKNLYAILVDGADPTDDYRWEKDLTAKMSVLSKKGAIKVTSEQKDYGRKLYDKVSEAYEAWHKATLQPGWEVWGAVRRQIPELGLLYSFRNEIRRFLDDTNTMVIGDTNTMLSRIISDDEVPFIYERLGTRITNYLIDEFQDTSRMQWDNFRPLLNESMSLGYDNLIIGDAKQSIYRFRNADPSIITDIVPGSFNRRVIDIKGSSVAENTNWRSNLRIVQFNNYFFSRIHKEYEHVLGNLYANAVQFPHKHSKNRGYVEIMPFDAKLASIPGVGESEINEEKNATAENEEYRVIGPMISEMLSRGYRQRDIAVLCNRNETGQLIISKLIDYNEGLPDEDKIRFISEQSLLLGHNHAVSVVISALRSLAEGIYSEAPDTIPVEEDHEITDWHNIATRFTIFSHAHPTLSLTERISKFFEEADTDSQMTELVRRIQAITIPALIEGIIDTFIPEGRNADVAFLAALQDAALDYSASYTSDLSSFLDWWDKKGSKISITSPEDTDAVNVMTIHKSKGLEFECVILPDICVSFEPKKRGPWGWTEIPEYFADKDRLPKMLPVIVDANLAGMASVAESGEIIPGPFASLWKKEKEMVLTDTLNKIYVAFTRAASELYILSKNYRPKRRGEDLSSKLGKYLVRGEEGPDCSLPEYHEDILLTIDTDQLNEPIEGEGIFYGHPLLPDEVREIVSEHDRKRVQRPSENINDYFTNSYQELPRFRGETPVYTDPDDDDDRGDPRSEGNLLHGIMQRVNKASDLPAAIMYYRMRGQLPEDKVEQYEAMLSEALDAASHTGWFDGSMQVMKERPLLIRRQPMYRPDRIMVNESGDAIIVDYKFGKSDNNSAHHRQVRRYIGNLKNTGLYRSVKGYLWYMREKRIEEVNAG